MLNTWPAFEEQVITDGFAAVRLRPTLRAASALEARFGFKKLFQHVEEWRVSTIREIVLACAADHEEAAFYLASADRAPIRNFFEAAHMPVAALCRAFIPTAKGSDNSPSDSTPMPWRELYRQLFRTATSYLQLSPAEAWASTPNEITEAFDAHIAMLKTTGILEDSNEKQNDSAQAARNIAEGLDPEFDRDGLRALKARLAGGR